MTYTAAADAGVRVNGGSPTPYSITADGVTGSGNVGGIAQPGTVTCSGQVKATFAWVPAAGQTVETDPPPSHVIVRETGSASWAGDAGSCADGLGNAATGGTFGQTSAGTFRQLFSIPGVQFETLCFPTASASITAENPSGLDNGTAQIAYSVEAFPVWVETTGWQFHEGERKLQTGQRLTAEVKYPAALESTQNTFQWGDPQNGSFADYVIVNGPTEYSADWTDYSPPDTRTTTLFFSEGKTVALGGTQIEMTCNAVLWLEGEPFPIQAKAPKFTLYAPEFREEQPSEAIGRVRLTLAAAPYPETLLDPESFWLRGVSFIVPAGTAYVGMWFHWRVVEPYFTENPHGQWCYTQTVAPKFHYIVPGGQHWHNYHHGIWGLDNRFPASLTFAAVDSPGRHYDFPGFKTIDNATWLSFEGDFKDWAMYQPPGSLADVRWVPVHIRGWECQRLAAWVWNENGVAIYAYLNEGTAKFKGVPIAGDLPFPEWTLRHVNGAGWLPGPPP